MDDKENKTIKESMLFENQLDEFSKTPTKQTIIQQKGVAQEKMDQAFKNNLKELIRKGLEQKEMDSDKRVTLLSTYSQMADIYLKVEYQDNLPSNNPEWAKLAASKGFPHLDNPRYWAQFFAEDFVDEYRKIHREGFLREKLNNLANRIKKGQDIDGKLVKQVTEINKLLDVFKKEKKAESDTASDSGKQGQFITRKSYGILPGSILDYLNVPSGARGAILKTFDDYSVTPVNYVREDIFTGRKVEVQPLKLADLPSQVLEFEKWFIKSSYHLDDKDTKKDD